MPPGWTPATPATPAVWLDPDSADALKADAAGTTPATTVVRRVAGRGGAGYASGTPADADAARIDAATYPGATALYLRGVESPFTTVSGLAGGGQGFTLAVDFCLLSASGPRVLTVFGPDQVGYYETWSGNRFMAPTSNTPYASIAAGSASTGIGRRRLIIRGTPTGLKVKINGVDYTVAGPDAEAFTSAVIGGAATPGYSLHGSLREWVLYGAALSDDDAAILDAYWLLRPTPVPFPTTGPLVVCDGNSIVAGYAASADKSYPSIVGRSLGIRVCNVGAPAFKTPELTSGAATHVDVHYSASRAKNVLCFQEGINHIAVGGATGAAAYTAIRNYCLARQSAGWLVVALNVQPCASVDWTPTMETARTECNALVAANWADFADALVDVTTGNFADMLNPAYSPDGTHWTDALAAEAAALVATAVGGLL